MLITLGTVALVVLRCALAGYVIAHRNFIGKRAVVAVLLYAGYFSRIPRELEEAAIMDGAGFLRTFFRVMLPLAGPVTATVGPASPPRAPSP
ncbi:ABC transporter permease subunit [Nonomuraea sp. NPDC003707]